MSDQPDTMTMLIAGTAPVVIDETRGFWKGTLAEELRIQVCQACGHRQLPGGPCCRACLADAVRWERASGGGRVFSFTVVHHAFHPSFAAEVPYVVADIELEEGPILTSNVTDIDPGAVRIGMPVAAWFDEPARDAFGVEYRLPKFREES